MMSVFMRDSPGGKQKGIRGVDYEWRKEDYVFGKVTLAEDNRHYGLLVAAVPLRNDENGVSLDSTEGRLC